MTLQFDVSVLSLLATFSLFLAGYLIGRAKEITTVPANQNPGKEIALTELKEELQKVKDVSTALEKILNHLVQKEIVQSAILASEQGLLVAGNDEHSDALAVIAAMFDDLVKRLPNTPPLVNEVKRIDIVGEDNTIITAQYFQMVSGQLILVSLTTAPAPDWTPLQQLIELIDETLTTISKFR